ncbi:MMPL family transporter [Streptomyces sp. NP160]|uniref:MMPL family transporter n=1 Tax=Streptomyces sp. NP160 TaxID=2586637 RepID=UPI001C5714CD|nr:MMPL family transporter [Streptomyces sp. NP160]
MTAPVGRSSAWLTVVLGLLVALGLTVLAPSPDRGTGVSAGLPSSAESVRVAELERQLPGADATSALVVVRRDGGLQAADTAALQQLSGQLAAIAEGGRVAPPVTSPDGTTALVAVPLSSAGGTEALAETVGAIRADVRSTTADLPSGLTAEVTGGAAFSTDIAAQFEGANLTLLLTTVLVVAALLLVTYRSPVLWLVPLAVVGASAAAATALFAVVSRTFDVVLDPSTGGIADVLVFGAGTNYALLLIARYREELRREADRRLAMRRAWRGAAPAIAASAGTVVLSLLALSFAVLGSNRSVGQFGALGIAVAALFALLVLPAALVLCGRGVFWPFVPRVGSAETSLSGPWSRIGRAVVQRPWRVVAVAVAVLAVMAAGISGARLGLSQTEQFRVEAEAVTGVETLAKAFPAGAADPARIVVRSTDQTVVAAVVDTATATEGVASATAGRQGAGLTEVTAVLDADPGSPAAQATVERLRTALDAVPGTDGEVLVGGSTASDLDVRTATERDLRVVAPLVLLIVLLVLVVLLRAVVGPLVLVATVVASFFAALGAGNWLATDVLGYPGLDTGVPLLAFLFLVALGVDYNIFLVTRVREEVPARGTHEAVVVGVSVTGAVITSAGVLLAAVFTVLGVLPLITLTELGIIVGIGVLLDTLLVRTLLVPALFTLLDRWAWWPGALSRPSRHRDDGAHGDGSSAGAPAPELSAR